MVTISAQGNRGREIGPRFFALRPEDMRDDDDALDDMKGSSREYTLLRSEESSHVRGWIRGSTKIGPVLDVKVCYHQGRYGVEIMIQEMKNHLTQKVGFEGTLRLDPYWKSQPATYKVNMEWKLDLSQ